MNTTKFFRRTLAIMLSIIMTMGMIPTTALAEQNLPSLEASDEVTVVETLPNEVEPQENKIITAFDELEETVLGQLVPLGTTVDGLTLPATLKVTVKDGDSTVSEDIPVTWQAEPEYDGNTSGIYTFTAQIGEGYVLDEGVELPQIMVGVDVGIQPFTSSVVDITGKSIPDIQTEIQAAIDDAVGGEIVTVIGSITNANGTLTLNIPSGKTVKWAATLRAAASFGDRLIAMNDNGTFEVVSGGEVSATISTAIWATGASSTVTVNGEGKVQAIGGSGYAISTSGNVEVKDSAEVSATTGKAINATGASSTITVSGGTVSNQATDIYNAVINVSSSSSSRSNVIISGTGKVRAEQAGGRVITTFGSVEVKDTAEVSAITGVVILVNNKKSAIKVSGRGKVYGAGKFVISTYGGVEVSDTAEVSATTGVAIDASDESATVKVSGGGKVQATAVGGYAIQTLGSVEVKDSAEVSATTGTAVFASSSVTISGGTVRATTGRAIYTGRTATVSDGLVFAYGNGIRGNVNVIEGAYTCTSPGVVVAWNQAAGHVTYPFRSEDDIIKDPSTASVQWAKSGSDNGISYKNGDNTGFIPLDGITIEKIILTASGLNYTIPSGHIYNGSHQGIGAVTCTDPDFNATTGGSIMLVYNTDPAAVLAGTYNVTASITGGTEYASTTISLGTYTIDKADTLPTNITVTPYSGVYDGNAHTISVVDTASSGVVTYSATQVGPYGTTNITATDVGTHTVYFKVDGDANYNDYYGSSTITITPKPINIIDASIATKNYDGTTVATVTSVTFDTPNTMVLGTDFTAIGVFDNANAGSGKTVTISVSLENTTIVNNFVIATGNYALTGQSIGKGSGLATSHSPAIYAKAGVTRNYSFNMDNIMLNKTDTGAKTYSAVRGTDTSNIVSNIQVLGNTLTYDIAATAAIGDRAYVTITITSDNYTDTTATLTILVIAKDIQTVAFDTPMQTKTYGDGIFTQIATLQGAGGAGAITYASDNTAVAMVNAVTGEVTIIGAGSAEITATKAEDNDWYMAIATYELTVSKKTVTVKAEDKSIRLGSALPALTVNYTGFVATDSESNALTTQAVAKFNVPDSSTAGTTTIDFQTDAVLNSTNGANYILDHQGGTLTITPSSSSGGGFAGGLPVDTSKNTNMPTTATQTVTGKPNKAGKLIMKITKKMVENSISEAKKQWAGRESYGISINFNNTSKSTKNLTATIEAAALDQLVSQGIKTITIQCGIYRITLDEKAIKSLKTQSIGKVTATVTPYKVSGTAAKTIGSRPVFDIKFKDSKGKVISNFGAGTITRGIKYKLPAKEASGNLFIVKVVKQKPQWINQSSYNNGWMLWSGNSCSVYGVGYKKAATYTDTAKHWAKDSIDFVFSRGLLTSTKKTTFKPNAAITRADFLMALGKLAGADVSIYKTSSFTDVANNNAAMQYIEWAVANKVVKGIGNNQFGPTEPITREQMALILSNYAKACDITLPVSREYPAFTDASKITSEFKDAVRAIVQTGVLVSKDDNKFDPQGKVTRAEVAAILHRFVVLIIDEGTSRGWVRNDSGTLIYIDSQGRIQIKNNTLFFYKIKRLNGI